MRCLMYWIGLVASLMCTQASAGHAYSLWGDIKYPAGFAHFDYVNPKAPKGGELVAVSNLRVSTFDKYNPFTLKGTAPAYLSDLLFETLLTSSLDEPGTGYGLLAEDVVAAPDGLSATFRLRKEARFHNGKPVLAADVKHSFETLRSKLAAPGYRSLLEEVDKADIVDERTIRFVFKTKNRELPLTVGSLPIFSRDWGLDEKTGKAKPFDQIITDTPIASGPYKIGPVKFGRDISYVRDAQYWGRELNVNVGHNNFDRITIKIYKDNTARLEGLKAGEFDFMQFYSAGDWARRVSGKRFDNGELVKGEFKHRLPTGYQSYIFNTRRDKFKDARVREAIGLAMDFNWMSRMMFYGIYARVNGLFGSTDCQATGSPSPEELKLMEPWRGQIPEAAFGPMTVPPNSDGQDRLRENLRRALKLLAEAGWTVQDGQLKNAKGERMVIELLDSSEGGSRTHSPLIRNLAKLGIELKMRIVDFSLYQQRLQSFDYDMIIIAFQGTHNPGQEYVDIFGSKAADTEGSGNYAGVKSPAVDAITRNMVGAQTKAELLPACRALERVIAHSHVFVPQWSSTQHNVAYAAKKLAKPPAIPPYARADNWLLSTWWAAQPTPLLEIK
jgi:microcin C transport system substrate-binding protein